MKDIEFLNKSGPDYVLIISGITGCNPVDDDFLFGACGVGNCYSDKSHKYKLKKVGTFEM